jgi:hypothetical protein
MRHQPTEQEGRESLIAHAVERALEARATYGGPATGLTRESLEVLLCDRKFVRHPVRLEFNASALSSGEFAHPTPVSEDDPSAGFIMHVHPAFEHSDDVISLLVAYQLVTINYGDIAGHEAAESFGAALCGMHIESYYQTLCELTDSLK